jgi:hypothetical protein
MSSTDVAVIALLVILAAVVWRKDVKAAFSFLGLGSFSLEATEPKRRSSRSPREDSGERRRLGSPRDLP